jgi:hypothetical protein
VAHGWPLILHVDAVLVAGLEVSHEPPSGREVRTRSDRLAVPTTGGRRTRTSPGTWTTRSPSTDEYLLRRGRAGRTPHLRPRRDP